MIQLLRYGGGTYREEETSLQCLTAKTGGHGVLWPQVAPVARVGSVRQEEHLRLQAVIAGHHHDCKQPNLQAFSTSDVPSWPGWLSACGAGMQSSSCTPGSTPIRSIVVE
jgi:hypothetical protein